MGVTAFDPVQCCNNIPKMKEKTLGRARHYGRTLDVQNIVDVAGTSGRPSARKSEDALTNTPPAADILITVPLYMYNPAAYAPGQPLGIVMDECEKYGLNYYL